MHASVSVGPLARKHCRGGSSKVGAVSRWLALACAALVSSGCQTRLEGAPEWQNALLNDAVEVQWGAQGTEYLPLSEWAPVTGRQLRALREVFSKPVGSGALKCLVHIDGKLRTGATDVRVCLGCGQLFASTGGEFVLRDKDALRAVMTDVLGPRPQEPDPFHGD